MIRIKTIGTLLLGCLLAGTLQAQTPDSLSLSEKLYEIYTARGIDQSVQQYRSMMEASDSSAVFDGQELNKFGYRLLNEQENQDAVTIFKLNTEIHPETINYWDSLTDGYLANGNYSAAAREYRKILAMLDDQELPPRQETLLRSKATTNLYRVEHFSPPSPQTLRYDSYYGGNPAGRWDMENVAGFNERHPDTKVSYTGNNVYFNPVPTNIADTFEGSDAADAGVAPINGYLLEFVDRGKIADISDLWEDNNWDQVFPKPFKEFSSYEGRQYFIPMAYQWNPVWYRKDIFAKHDLHPPKTWEELLELCDRLNELGYAPFSISVQNWPPPIARWFSILNLRLNGAEYHRKVMRGEISYKDERIKSVFEHWRELFRHEAFPDSSYHYNYSQGIQALTSGEAVMYNLGEWIFESVNEEQGSKLDFFEFPELQPEIERAEIVHTYGAFITGSEQFPEMTKELMIYLAGKKSQESNVASNSRVVASRQVDDSLYSDVQRRIIDRVNHTSHLVPLYEFGVPPQFGSKALALFQEYWKNPEDIDTILNKLEQARLEHYGR